MEKEWGNRKITFYSTDALVSSSITWQSWAKSQLRPMAKWWFVFDHLPTTVDRSRWTWHHVGNNWKLLPTSNWLLQASHYPYKLERFLFFCENLFRVFFLTIVQFSLFMNSKGCVFSQERSRTEICLICIPGKAWQVTWEKIGSQGRRFQPIRGKERPRGEGNQPIRSILDMRSVFADFLENANHIAA